MEKYFIPDYSHFKIADLERLHSIYVLALLGDELSDFERAETTLRMIEIQKEMSKRGGKNG